ncbi:MAG: tetratricopeptide repeat protein [Gammaproteobacteria bacterium]
MSIINQMLKDLEKRQKNTKPSSGNILQGLNSSSAFDTGHINKKLWAGILGVFVLALYIIFRIGDSADPTFSSPNLPGKKIEVPTGQPVIDPVTKTMFDSITKSNAPEGILPQATPATDYLPREILHHNDTPATSPVESNEPITLKQVDWQVGEHAMTLEFHLQQQIPYDVVIDDEKNIVNLTFPKTFYNDQRPINMTRNGFVSNIETSQEGNFLKIKIHLEPGVHLQSADYLSETKEPTLVMAFVSVPHAMHTSQPSQINKVMVPLTRDQRAEIARQDAISLVNKGNSEGAITLLENAMATHPDYLLARETLISILLDKNDVGYAKELLATGITKTPKYVPFVMLQARLDIAENNLTSAEAILKTVSPTMEENLDYFALEASLAQKLKKFDVSEQLYADLVKHEPANGAWWMGYGISLEENDKKNAALMAYRRAVETNNLSSALRSYTNQRIVALGG